MSKYQYGIQIDPEYVAKTLKKDLSIEENSATDLGHVLRQLNIRIIYREIKYGVLGACKVEGLKKLIVINPNINNKGRERFTISHEIGHLLLHHGSCCCYGKDLRLWITSNDREQQANSFASELLLPSIPLVHILRKKDITIELIKNLAEKYGTSLLATAIRMVKLCDDQVALFYHQDDKILWSVKSPECQFKIENCIVSPISIANRANHANRLAKGYVDTAVWYSNAPDNYKCFEETMYFSKLNTRLTIARLEDEEW